MRSDPPPVIVAGAAGFVGRAVLEELARRGCRPIGVARRGFAVPAGAQAMVLDGLETLTVPEGAVLIHCAEAPQTDPALTAEQDARARRDRLENLLEKAWGRFVYVSSAVVYGDALPHPRRPDEPVAPSSPYGQAKAACEALAQTKGAAVVRLSNIYGPGMSSGTVLGILLDQIPGQGPVTVRDTSPVRDYLWVEDAARGLADIARGQEAGVFNLGTGRGTSVLALALAALNAAGEGTRPVRAAAAAAAITPSTVRLDPSATTAVFGWQPRVAVEDGIARLIAARGAANQPLIPPNV